MTDYRPWRHVIDDYRRKGKFLFLDAMNHVVSFIAAVWWWLKSCNGWMMPTISQRQPADRRFRLRNTALAFSHWQDHVAQAIRLSQNGDSNITAAHEAVDLWERLLTNEDVSSKNNYVIRSLCQTIYGTCLVRIGRDSAAIDAFNQALLQSDNSPPPIIRHHLMPVHVKTPFLLGRLVFKDSYATRRRWMNTKL